MSGLFEPCRVGGIDLKNRFVRSATWEAMADGDGAVTDALVDVYRTLARGGVGLIMTGYSYVDPRGKCNPGMIGVDSDRHVEGLSRLAAAVHEEGGKVVLQIAHGGAQSSFDTGMPNEGPSAVEDRSSKRMPVEMTADDIDRVTRAFAAAAGRAGDAGFDGVELHCAHGYLLSQFLSPYCNVRTDEYGGQIEGRARFVLEVYRAVRKAVGDNYPVMAKINAEDCDGVGLNQDDSVWVCAQLADMGLDLIELSGGVPSAGKLSPARTPIDTPEKEAYFAPYARRLKPRVACPVSLVGGLRSLDVIEKLHEEGVADLFSLSRPLISEPDLIGRWADGDTRSARCISCQMCFRAVMNEHRLYCFAFSRQDCH